MQHIIKPEQGRRKYLALFPFQLSSPPLLPFFFFTISISSPHSFTSLGALFRGDRYRWHMSWVRPATVSGTVPWFLTVALHKGKWDEDNKVTLGVRTLPLAHLDEPGGRELCDSCFPPANSHMFEPKFLIHELGLILQPNAAQCYCWSSACSRAGAGVFLEACHFLFLKFFFCYECKKFFVKVDNAFV